MINRRRVALMTRIAVCEKEQARAVRISSDYFRGDYIGIKLMKNFFRVTAAYVLGFGLWVLLEMDFVMEKLGVLDVEGIGIGVLASYGILTALYLIMTYAVCAVRYRRAAAVGEERQKLLTELEREYAVEGRRAGRVRKPEEDDT